MYSCLEQCTEWHEVISCNGLSHHSLENSISRTLLHSAACTCTYLDGSTNWKGYFSACFHLVTIGLALFSDSLNDLAFACQLRHLISCTMFSINDQLIRDRVSKDRCNNLLDWGCKYLYLHDIRDLSLLKA